MGHQRFGLTVGDIAEVEHVGQVGQPQALGLGGQAATTRNGKYRVGLCLGRAQHPGEVFVFQQVRHAEIVRTPLQLRMLGKNAVIGCQALHLLPGVVDDVHFFQRHTVIFVNFRFRKLRHRDDALGLLGNAAVLQAVPGGAQAVAAGRIKIAPGAVADIVNDCNTAEAKPWNNVARSKALGPAPL